MTEQEALDTAAYRAISNELGKSLQRIAELEDKLSSLTPSEEDRDCAKTALQWHPTTWAPSLKDGVFTLLRKFVLQETPVDPLVEAFEEVHGYQMKEGEMWSHSIAARLREVLARRGLSIVKEPRP